MYGLLLEGVAYSVRGRYGEKTWAEIRERAGVTQDTFGTHMCYGETLIPSIAEAASEVTGESVNSFMELMGVSFVNFVSQYGYDTILKVLGRNMRDFLNGLDNLHEYLKTSYPKMRSPSFFVEEESKHGMTIHYRSRRKGYVHYVMGQIKQVAYSFYDTQIEIEIVEIDERGKLSHVVFKLHFDNKGYKDQSQRKKNTNQGLELTVKPSMLFSAFPFHIFFGRDMKIKSVGQGLEHVCPNMLGKRLDFVLTLTRPPLGFNFENILSHTNSAFELKTIKSFQRRSIRRRDSIDEKEDEINGDAGHDLEVPHLHLKGQMKYILKLDAFIFLATPVLENIDRMFEYGVFINDLSMHDVSRDLVLIGVQQSKDLKSALNQERQKSKKLEETMKMFESELQRADQLLYQMIPKEVADQLRTGKATGDTCSVYKEVSVMFIDVVDFNWICSQVTPMQIVTMLNETFTKLDRLTERQKVFKVETVGSTYMTVSGAPTIRQHHAVYVTEMALEALEAIQDVVDCSCGDHIRLRIGIHTGPIVAGVVGLQVPRYCLFGDTVNTASRMQSNGAAMKIHITETTKQLLESHPYEVEFRGTIEIKGKGEMNTYYVLRRTIDDTYAPPPSPILTPNHAHGSTRISTTTRHSPVNPQYTPIRANIIASQGSDLSKVALPGSNGLHHENGSSKGLQNIANEHNGKAPINSTENVNITKQGVLRAKTCTML